MTAYPSFYSVPSGRLSLTRGAFLQLRGHPASLELLLCGLCEAAGPYGPSSAASSGMFVSVPFWLLAPTALLATRRHSLWMACPSTPPSPAP